MKRQKVIKQIKEFFLEDEEDEILEECKLNAYIENIKEECFYGGNLNYSFFQDI